MSIVLYKAPNCLRCNIVKGYMEANGIGYDYFDLHDDKDIVNKFYRDNRSSLYRNPEGVEFPMFHDVEKNEIRQGTGVVLAWLLAGKDLDDCVCRSELLHGWISGLDVSRCPDGMEDKFLELVRLLAKGGLTVQLVSDGRKADLLEKILAEDLVAKMIVNIPGPADVYADYNGKGAPSTEDLMKTINVVRKHQNFVIRLWLTPLKKGDEYYWLTPEQGGEAAKWVLEAAGNDASLPFGIQANREKIKGVEPLSDNLLPYRSKVRNYLPKAEVLKDEESH